MTNVIPFKPVTTNSPVSAQQMADSMMQHSAKMVKECLEQREEILKAFVAQHGFNPDEAIQVNRDGAWTIIKIEKADTDKLRRAVILSRLGKEKLTPWRRFCLWMAGV